MAILKGNIQFTGGLGNLSAFRKKGSDAIIIRTKGGASKKKILKSPAFELTRQNYTEFSGCGKMGGSIRRSMIALVPLADYNFTPGLNSLCKLIQTMDTESKRGEREIYLSKHKDLLIGFSLNRQTSFESVVRHLLELRLERGDNRATAHVKFPALTPGVNLIIPKSYPLFRFLVNLGYVSDCTFSKYGYSADGPSNGNCVYTDWFHSGQYFEAREVSAELNLSFPLNESQTLILSVGIQMGMPLSSSVVVPSKYGGCAKIFAVG